MDKDGRVRRWSFEIVVVSRRMFHPISHQLRLTSLDPRRPSGRSPKQPYSPLETYLLVLSTRSKGRSSQYVIVWSLPTRLPGRKSHLTRVWSLVCSYWVEVSQSSHLHRGEASASGTLASVCEMIRNFVRRTRGDGGEGSRKVCCSVLVLSFAKQISNPGPVREIEWGKTCRASGTTRRSTSG